MAYSDFTLNDIKRKFQIIVDEKHTLFDSAPQVPPQPLLDEILEESLPLALAISSEKARSEFIIAPMMMAFRKLARDRASLFSGINFNVDPAQGLTGFCDFIISRSPEQLTLTAPVLIAIEAKNENINAGMPQCMAAMIAARIFNQRENLFISPIYGVVTTGTNWRFLKLESNVIYIDQREYYINQKETILGILNAIVENSDANVAEQIAA